ncbi:protein containing DUF1566 [Sulfurimonas gotlandica GD1]|uniref:Protein containing DUF1566 n=2 Tax=Sulfurimonas TaxID=202746 RepID=B6BLB7_SULGG|nr:DUF1566 domain-containing protein [Sulfurimonas gotlandica]EDZ62204.1 conserved domain protein [Sulfurimonas gotlandica GD1]EHP28571.1 protein containing DUF1566 [Sulfurimonas gotlandica GD1]
MMKLLITFTLILTTLFSYEIVLGKSSNKDKKVTESKPKIALVRDDSKELVIDKNTGLMWQDNIDAKTIRKNRKDAKQYCRSLVFAGYDDWYLPRLKELKSIVDESKYDPAIKFGFKNIQSYHYWTSSPNLSANIINVINIDFKNGQTYKTNRRGRCNIRCVRGKYNL